MLKILGRSPAPCYYSRFHLREVQFVRYSFAPPLYLTNLKNAVRGELSLWRAMWDGTRDFDGSDDRYASVFGGDKGRREVARIGCV
jgi:hypothetical protein